MPKQERARVTRGNIVSSAAVSFHQHGFGKTSLSDIIEEAGVTKGALYFHFESKEDVARAVLDAQLDVVTASHQGLVKSGRSSLEVLVRLCTVPARATGDSATRADFRLATEVSSLQSAIAEPYYRRWLSLLATLAEQARDEGDLKAEINPSELSRIVVGAIPGMELMSEAFSGGDDLMDREREFWQLLLPGIVPEDRKKAIRKMLDSIFGDL